MKRGFVVTVQKLFSLAAFEMRQRYTMVAYQTQFVLYSNFKFDYGIQYVKVLKQTENLIILILLFSVLV